MDVLGTKRIRITIDHTVIDAALTNFPVPVILTAANFDFSLARPDGFDLRFVADDFVTALPYERVSFSAVTETAEIHVLVPSADPDTDTVFYLYYGDLTATDGADPEAVWDDNFVMVQHMNDTTTSTITDSTQYDTDGTKTDVNEPIEVAGQIGKAQQFDGSNDGIYVNDVNALNMGTDNSFTISLWMKAAAPGAGVNLFIKRRTATLTSPGYLLSQYSQYNNKAEFWIADGTNYKGLQSSVVVFDNTWHHVAAIRDTVNDVLQVIVDGVYIATVSETNVVGSLNSTVYPSIGYLKTTTGVYNFLNGLIDEPRISNVARSAAWINAEFNAGNGTLLTLADDPPTQRALSGSLGFSGGIALRNPRWLLLPNGLNWEGVWREGINYEVRDAVVRADGAGTLHAFVSKTAHNTGNDPLGSTGWVYWTRLWQEPWKQ